MACPVTNTLIGAAIHLRKKVWNSRLWKRCEFCKTFNKGVILHTPFYKGYNHNTHSFEGAITAVHLFVRVQTAARDPMIWLNKNYTNGSRHTCSREERRSNMWRYFHGGRADPGIDDTGRKRLCERCPALMSPVWWASHTKMSCGRIQDILCLVGLIILAQFCLVFRAQLLGTHFRV